jgi:predicted transcriptional regulator
MWRVITSQSSAAVCSGEFFARMRVNAAGLDRSAKLRPGVRISFEDPADFLEVITPARVRLLRQIARKPIALAKLAAALERDTSAVRRDVAVLERQCLVKTRKVANPGHGSRTVVERVAAAIELATTV